MVNRHFTGKEYTGKEKFYIKKKREGKIQILIIFSQFGWKENNNELEGLEKSSFHPYN
jgi:hypothetical protein